MDTPRYLQWRVRVPGRVSALFRAGATSNSESLISALAPLRPHIEQRNRRLKSSTCVCGCAIVAICAGRSDVLCPQWQTRLIPRSAAVRAPMVRAGRGVARLMGEIYNAAARPARPEARAGAAMLPSSAPML